ncbi:IS66 family insertion sequence element accessory protein TnpA [Marinomonas sp. IMCC 4694]|uniref:IS66 family insertion sequence element accessory protein TnpA n=1 Tax=Marinomonas sp. IMCC 4694 TaxID=2605432 RepID=UPI0011E7CAC9|nr:transposase [Marinomonas sp. IMCC 4694]TYL46898.1 IS66 family insertion sequence element accessory protein TnpB [Marinomonas sp. IMCC 4694]TYL47907.1 IS66 family insertion sequence element accessory protein TnpB [Marinomonas sp. IMCC 4694]TYL48426.1 IS66 family insertion sequence element accessory protein TnpB [Marinomonas sp. IMCC 4694]TYL48665.1 IS66 family insertion sequence element accessory protein TnpB [Marinomonas sp. IMCC 4694]
MTKPYTRRSSSEWQQIIDDQAESGLSAPQYCKQHQVRYASFSKWRQHFSGTKTSPDSSQSDFIDLSQMPALSGTGRWNITLCLGDGIELRLSRD